MAPSSPRGKDQVYWCDETDNCIAVETLNGTSQESVQKMSYTAARQRYFSLTATYAVGNYDVDWHWYNAGGKRVISHRTTTVTGCRNTIRTPGPGLTTSELQATYYSTDALGAGDAGGATPGDVNTRTGFTGASTPNANGGFVYLRNRWHDPQTGRLLTQDFIGIAGGVLAFGRACGGALYSIIVTLLLERQVVTA